jgi:xanthine dehydrogenase YagS FAD-binding subunit
MALLAYGAEVGVAAGADLPVAGLYGDGTDGRHDHQLGEHEILTAVQMPPALEHERAAYSRATSRALAEWPLVEAVVRLIMSGETIEFAAVAVGGVAPVPLRLEQVEQALTGRPASGEVLARAASLSTSGASSLPMTRYKLELLSGTLCETLERALRWRGAGRDSR